MKRAIFTILLLLILMLPVYLNAQWVRTYGGSESGRAYSVQQTSDGGYIIAGSSSTFGIGLMPLIPLEAISE